MDVIVFTVLCSLSFLAFRVRYVVRDKQVCPVFLGDTQLQLEES